MQQLHQAFGTSSNSRDPTSSHRLAHADAHLAQQPIESTVLRPSAFSHVLKRLGPHIAAGSWAGVAGNGRVNLIASLAWPGGTTPCHGTSKQVVAPRCNHPRRRSERLRPQQPHFHGDTTCPSLFANARSESKPASRPGVASEFTSAIREIILSPLDLISVVFHEATPENTYRSGEPTSETLIFCHIRDGRSDGAVLSLAKKVSSIWSACTGATEDEVEVLVTLYPAKYVVRGGERLPEAPRV